MKRGLASILLSIVLLVSLVHAAPFFQGSVWDDVITGQATDDASEQSSLITITGNFLDFLFGSVVRKSTITCPEQTIAIPVQANKNGKPAIVCKAPLVLYQPSTPNGKGAIDAHLNVGKKTLPLKINIPTTTTTEGLYFVLLSIDQDTQQAQLKVSSKAFSKVCKETFEIAISTYDENKRQQVCASTSTPCTITKCNREIQLIGASNSATQVAVDGSAAPTVAIGSQENVNNLYVYAHSYNPTTKSAKLTVSPIRIDTKKTTTSTTPRTTTTPTQTQPTAMQETAPSQSTACSLLDQFTIELKQGDPPKRICNGNLRALQVFTTATKNSYVNAESYADLAKTDGLRESYQFNNITSLRSQSENIPLGRLNVTLVSINTSRKTATFTIKRLPGPGEPCPPGRAEWCSIEFARTYTCPSSGVCPNA